MKPSYYLALAAGFAAGSARAQLPILPPPVDRPAQKLPRVPPPDEPALLPAPKPLALPVTAPIGGVVLLRDDRLLEGTVTAVADTVVVRRGALDVPFPKADVVFVGRTRDDAYQYRKALVPAGDTAARLAFAHWCVFNGLREQALAEAREVRKTKPDDATARQLEKSLEESLRRFPPAGRPAAPPIIPPSSKAAAPVPEPDVPPELVAAFRGRVQPVLTNKCAECHARPDHTAFPLSPVPEYDPTPAAVKRNLRSALAHLRADDPANSPLLTKAFAAHGGMKQPAFTSRQAPAFLALADWARQAAGFAPKAEPAPAAPPSRLPAVPPPPDLSKAGLPPVVPASAVRFGQDVVVSPPTGPDPANTGPAVDEFDPSLFNRQRPETGKK